MNSKTTVTDTEPSSMEQFMSDETIASPGTLLIEGEPVLLGDPLLPTIECNCTNQIVCENCKPPPLKRQRISEKVNNSSPELSSNHVNWPCAFCERYFTAKKNLYKHYRTVHPNSHCAQCVNHNENGATTSKKAQKKPKKTPKEIEDELKTKFSIKECRIVLKRLNEKSQISPMPRENGFPRMYSSSKLSMNVECDATIGNDVFIGNDILTEEVVIEELPQMETPSNETRKELLECEICGEIYSNKIELINHLKLKHSGKKVPQFKCDRCNVEFKILFEYQSHVDNCLFSDGFVSAYKGRNLFEELTNLRAIPMKEDENDDFEIEKAENQLVKSPTSVKDYDEKSISRNLKEDLTNEKKRRERKVGVLEDITKNPNNKFKCCDREKVKCKNDICMSPRVVIHRVSIGKRTSKVDKVAESPKKDLDRIVLTAKRTAEPPKKKRRKTKDPSIVPRKRGRPRKYPLPVDAAVQTTISISFDDDCSFSRSGSENEAKSDETLILNVEDDDDELNLTLSDDEIDVMTLSNENLSLNLLGFPDENIAVDESDFGQVFNVDNERFDQDKNRISNCFSVFT